MKSFDKVLKRCGQLQIDKEVWQWDYATDQPRRASEMTLAEKAASTQAQITQILRPVSTGA